jgi:hypothetical protein
VTIKNAEFGESDTGTPFFRLDCERDDGDFISAWIYLSEAAFAQAVKTLRDAFQFNGDFETAISQVTGRRCSIVTEFENFNGKDRLKVKWVNSLRAPVKPIEGGVSFLKKLTKDAKRVPIDAPRARASAPVKDTADFPSAKNPY